MQCDAWALGMCLHVMLCGCFPFDSSQEEEELLRSINAAEFSFSDPGWKALSADALDMVRVRVRITVRVRVRVRVRMEGALGRRARHGELAAQP